MTREVTIPVMSRAQRSTAGSIQIELMVVRYHSIAGACLCSVYSLFILCLFYVTSIIVIVLINSHSNRHSFQYNNI